LFAGLSVLLSNIPFWIIIMYFAVPSLPGWIVKNWLPTLFSENLGIEMATAGPITTITIAGASLIGVLIGGYTSDKWLQINIRGRIYTSAIGLALTIPSLLLIGYGHSLVAVISAAFCFGLGFGIFDCNNMPILCQFVSSRHRATAYGLLNLAGITAGAFITNIFGKSIDAGNPAKNFIYLAGVLVLALFIQLMYLKPKVKDFTE
jgi:sugar phosphate permease